MFIHEHVAPAIAKLIDVDFELARHEAHVTKVRARARALERERARVSGPRKIPGRRLPLRSPFPRLCLSLFGSFPRLRVSRPSPPSRPSLRQLHRERPCVPTVTVRYTQRGSRETQLGPQSFRSRHSLRLSPALCLFGAPAASQPVKASLQASSLTTTSRPPGLREWSTSSRPPDQEDTQDTAVFGLELLNHSGEPV